VAGLPGDQAGEQKRAAKLPLCLINDEGKGYP
jgi:hypothetical protein